MGRANTLKIRTPEYEHPFIYRDLIAVCLARWSETVVIENLPNSDIIKIFHIPRKEMVEVLKALEMKSVEVLEN